MPVGLASGVAQGWLDAMCNAANYTAPTGFFVKLHIGDPGAAGAGNPAVETTRKSASMAPATVTGTITSDADTTWVNVAATETISHVSFWSAAVAGFFLASDDLAVPRALTAGDTFTILTGDIDLSLVIIAT